MESLRIAVRYLLSRKSMGAVNVISRISVAGVAVATAATLCVLSVFNGFSHLAASRLSKLDPELRVMPAGGKVIVDADSLVAVIGGVDGVECAMPMVEERALAVYDGRQMPVTLMGVPEGFGAQFDTCILEKLNGITEEEWQIQIDALEEMKIAECSDSLLSRDV